MPMLENISAVDLLDSMMENTTQRTILFVDESELCTKYLSMSWVLEEAEVVVCDEAIANIFQVGKVPQYRFYLEGSEISNIIGGCNKETLLEHKKNVFGNLLMFKRRG
jgi:hypothetical protein